MTIRITQGGRVLCANVEQPTEAERQAVQEAVRPHLQAVYQLITQKAKESTGKHERATASH